MKLIVRVMAHKLHYGNSYRSDLLCFVEVYVADSCCCLCTWCHRSSVGFVATLPVRGNPLCCSPEREVEERRYDALQGEPI